MAGRAATPYRMPQVGGVISASAVGGIDRASVSLFAPATSSNAPEPRSLEQVDDPQRGERPYGSTMGRR
ncbi:hypothetical protein [Streptomyces sp. NBC_00328]|uniref:hypothetical protein n=1 Tax=Streptomyces sp. NBC_00328 TaxID=2903646 RepID=UPI002E2C8C78|nr:hypothetical protein [Streptomyces sp. NBC_00328]